MTDYHCERLRDLLPEWISGALGPEEAEAVENHLTTCVGCREEADVLRVLVRARPEPPPGLEATIQARVRGELGNGVTVHGRPLLDTEDVERVDGVVPLLRRRTWAPIWALSAAALLVLALGIKGLWDPSGQEVIQDPILVANQELLPEAWLWDDGMVAGAPVFDGLSDEDLEALLEEWEG